MTCRLIEIPSSRDKRGIISFLESSAPIIIQRVFYIHDIPNGEGRGGHAHRSQTAILIPMCGSFTAEIHGKHYKETFWVHQATTGLWIPPMHWVEITSNAIILGVCTHIYEEKDYIRDYEQFSRELYA